MSREDLLQASQAAVAGVNLCTIVAATQLRTLSGPTRSPALSEGFQAAAMLVKACARQIMQAGQQTAQAAFIFSKLSDAGLLDAASAMEFA